jgi:hypothetical protein
MELQQEHCVLYSDDFSCSVGDYFQFWGWDNTSSGYTAAEINLFEAGINIAVTGTDIAT